MAARRRSSTRYRRATRGEPQRVGDVLSSLLARRGYAQVQSAAELAEAWQKAAGEGMARHSRVGNVRRGVLEITVRNSTIMQELAFQKKRLLEKLRELSECRTIRDLRFRQGVVD